MEHVLPSHLRLARVRRALLPTRATLRSLRKPSRRQLALALLSALVLVGGFFWFRGSSFVSVEEVQLSGINGVEAGSIKTALIARARQMSTMNLSVGALEAAVARFPVVRSISVSPSFPHSLAIHVHEQLPVAVLASGAGEVAVAADGVVLGQQLATGGLAKIAIATPPTAGARVTNARIRSYLKVLGAAPAPLLPLVKEVNEGKQGITATMKGGLLVYFGNAARPHAKWASLSAVLSNPESAGAIYVDVRVPQRPAAGMPSGEGVSEEGQVSATDPTAAALAESLDRAVNGESPIEAVASEPPIEAVAGEAASSTGYAGEEAAEEPGSGEGYVAEPTSEREEGAYGSAATGEEAGGEEPYEGG